MGSQGRCDAGRAVGSRVTSQECGWPQGFTLPPPDRPWGGCDGPVAAPTGQQAVPSVGARSPFPRHEPRRTPENSDLCPES